jgi:RimJ/RimL family protein N-acetyltransferase
MNCPIIETERLVLRRQQADDFNAYAGIYADPEMSRFSGRPAAEPEEAWTRLLRQAGHWTLMGHGFFAVVEKTSGRLVGEAGLGSFHRRLGPDFDGVPEAGWAITTDMQGRGYATEAMTATLDWFAGRFGSSRSVCIIHSENAPSIRVAGKLGFREFGQREYRGYRGLMFERC